MHRLTEEERRLACQKYAFEVYGSHLLQHLPAIFRAAGEFAHNLRPRYPENDIEVRYDEGFSGLMPDRPGHRGHHMERNLYVGFKVTIVLACYPRLSYPDGKANRGWGVSSYGLMGKVWDYSTYTESRLLVLWNDIGGFSTDGAGFKEKFEALGLCPVYDLHERVVDIRKKAA